MFALGIDFLTGTAVMTSAGSREEAEWPPHPARVFMALVAAHYENTPLLEDGETALETWRAERAALEWLERQDPPALRFPADTFRRTIVKFYVPVNDSSTPANAARVKEADMRSALSVLPDKRSRQERTFPAVHTGTGGSERATFLIWQAEPEAATAEALRRAAQRVSRIGHSSSVVQMWFDDSVTLPAPTLLPTVSASRGLRLRIPTPGLLGNLDERFKAEEIDRFFALSETIATGSGAEKERAKVEFEAAFGMPWSRSASPPVRLRPSVALTATYVNTGPAETPMHLTPYDPELLILSKLDGPVLGLEATANLTAALRGFLLTGSEEKSEWFTGHKKEGSPADTPHLALLPLAYVGSHYADGHVMGMAIAFPRNVSAEDRAACLAGLLTNEHGEERDVLLTLGPAGDWTLQRETRGRPPGALQSNSWCEPSTVWASVTPVVLDRHPKHDPSRPEKRGQWRDEVAEIISQSCQRFGLPSPRSIDIDKTSWHRGAPRSKPGSGGMPLLAGKPGAPARQQIHVLLEFDQEVAGPLFLGAGRYRGYGLCKPLGPREP